MRDDAAVFRTVSGRVAVARERLALRVKIFRLLRAGAPSVAAPAIVVSVAAGLLPVVFFLGTSILIGRIPSVVGSSDGEAVRMLALPVALAGGAYLLLQVAMQLQQAFAARITAQVDGLVRDRAVAASVTPDGIGHLEDQRLRDHLSNAVGQLEYSPFTPGSACAGVVLLCARYSQYAGSVVVVVLGADWRVGLLLALGAAFLRHSQHTSARRFSEIWAVQARDRREAWYFRALSLGGEAAKDIRVLSILPWLRDRYRRASLAAVMPVQEARRSILFTPYLAYFAIGAAASASALGLAGYWASSGQLSLGGFALVLQGGLAIVYFGLFFEDSDLQIAYGLMALLALERFESGVPVAEAGLRDGPAAAAAPREAICFEQVSFAYPGSDHAVLSGLDLVLEAGRSTAIVGLNGAGKTTLVKLLGRLYEPSSGRISVDGHDLRDVDIGSWRGQLAAIFQDFIRYELPASDNITFGAPGLHATDGAVRTAAARAGALELLDGLPAGLTTPLSRQYAGGADLSGGEWQKVALARAFYAVEGGASVLVMDEPTASLDARSEARFFEEFVEATRGLTTVLISHRFATVRRADRIVVLEDGAISEEGSHEELLEHGGTYARLFRLQAQLFVDEAQEGGADA